MSLDTEPKPRTKPPARRSPPPRSASQVDELVAQNRQLQERLERLERSSPVQFVQAEPQPKASPRVADDEELTDFQRELRAATKPMPKDFKRDPKNFNFPKKWYVRTDGDIVQLQGDPQSRSYYTDKGLRMLTEEETQRWLKVERPKVLRLQQERAHLINSLRTARDLDPMLKASMPPQTELDWDHMSVAELRAQMEEINRLPTADGRPRIKLQRLKRLQDADDLAAQEESERMAGVETGTSREAFEDKLARARQSGREIEITPETRNRFA